MAQRLCTCPYSQVWISYNCCLTEQFVNQNFFKWTFWHKDCAHANTAKFEYLTIAVWQHNLRTRTRESCQMGFYGTEIVNHQLKSIGIFESCPMDFLEPDSSSHAKWTFMEQWSEPSSKASWEYYELMLERVVCETELSSYAMFVRKHLPFTTSTNFKMKV